MLLATDNTKMIKISEKNMQKINNSERRSFFGAFGAGLASIFALKFIPFGRLISKSDISEARNKKISVNIHPMATKRNNRRGEVNE